MLADETFELGHDGPVPAEAEVCLDALLKRSEPLLLESSALGIGELH